ncbi:MAG: helix-turn-helix domain-containing protein [Dehalococcoidia bacterium]
MGNDDDRRKDLLSIREASRMLNVHTNTLRNWTEQGILKTQRCGLRGDRKFKREDINALLRK